MLKIYLQPDEIYQMEKTTTCFRDRLLIRLLFHLSCRISEALAINVEDINFNQGTVIILHLKSRLRLSCPHCQAKLGRNHRFCPGCGSGIAGPVARAQDSRRQRILHLDSDTLEMLRDFIQRDGTQGLIFKINRHRAWQIISQCAERVGLPSLINPATGRVHKVSPHRLRDAFAVMAVQQDDSTDSLRMLQEQLGHASIGTTMHYRKVAGKELKDWYNKLWQKGEYG